MGDARSDWSIIRALSEVLEKPLPYSTTDEVRARLADVAPHFALVNTVQSPMWLNGEYFQVRAVLLCLGACAIAAHSQQVGAMGFMCTMPGRGLFANGVCARQAFKDRAGKAAVDKQAFSSSISNFFQTDVISRTSINMAKCVQTRASLAHK